MLVFQIPEMGCLGCRLKYPAPEVIHKCPGLVRFDPFYDAVFNVLVVGITFGMGRNVKYIVAGFESVYFFRF